MRKATVISVMTKKVQKNNGVSPGIADVGQGQGGQASIRGQGRRRGRGRGRGQGIRQQGRGRTGNSEPPNDYLNYYYGFIISMYIHY